MTALVGAPLQAQTVTLTPQDYMAFALVSVYAYATTMQVQPPGYDYADVDVSSARSRAWLKRGSPRLVHFGFRLQRAGDIAAGRGRVARLGGTIKEARRVRRLASPHRVFHRSRRIRRSRSGLRSRRPVESRSDLYCRSSERPPPRICRPGSGCSRSRSISNSSPFSISTKVREFLIGFV